VIYVRQDAPASRATAALLYYMRRRGLTLHSEKTDGKRVYPVPGKRDAGAEASIKRSAAGGLAMLQRFVDSAAIAAEIARVRLFGALRRRWQAVFGRPPAEHLTADLLRRMIAARIQEEVFRHLCGARRRRGPDPAG
jgi:hypothetical protein